MSKKQLFDMIKPWNCSSCLFNDKKGACSLDGELNPIPCSEGIIALKENN